MKKQITLDADTLKLFARMIFMDGRQFGANDVDKPFEGYMERRDEAFEKIFTALFGEQK